MFQIYISFTDLEKQSENGYQQFFHKPETIADDFVSQPSTFTDMIHTNYVCHYSTIEDVIEAANILSYSDVLTNEWRVRALKI